MERLLRENPDVVALAALIVWLLNGSSITICV